jgi:hypothetical protein
MTGQRQPAKVLPFVARFAESEFLGQRGTAGELQGPDPAVLGPVSLDTLTCHVPCPLKPRGLEAAGSSQAWDGFRPTNRGGDKWSGVRSTSHGIACTRVTTAMALIYPTDCK